MGAGQPLLFAHGVRRAHHRADDVAVEVVLAARLAANLIDNAIRHNQPNGHVRVATGIEDGRAYLTVSNTGPKIPANDVERLFEPFQRLSADRIAQQNDHHGLGLSIVRAIVVAHHATLTAQARQAGGLMIQVEFPADAGHNDHASSQGPNATTRHARIPSANR